MKPIDLEDSPTWRMFRASSDLSDVLLSRLDRFLIREIDKLKQEMARQRKDEA